MNDFAAAAFLALLVLVVAKADVAQFNRIVGGLLFVSARPFKLLHVHNRANFAKDDRCLGNVVVVGVDGQKRLDHAHRQNDD